MENIIYGVQHDDDNGDDDDDNAGHPQIGGNLHPLSLALQSRTAGDNHYHHRHHGLPANYHQSYSHLVGICHNDEGWEYDTVKFPPYT